MQKRTVPTLGRVGAGTGGGARLPGRALVTLALEHCCEPGGSVLRHIGGPRSVALGS